MRNFYQLDEDVRKDILTKLLKKFMTDKEIIGGSGIVFLSANQMTIRYHNYWITIHDSVITVNRPDAEEHDEGYLLPDLQVDMHITEKFHQKSVPWWRKILCRDTNPIIVKSYDLCVSLVSLPEDIEHSERICMCQIFRSVKERVRVSVLFLRRGALRLLTSTPLKNINVLAIPGFMRNLDRVMYYLDDKLIEFGERSFIPKAEKERSYVVDQIDV